MENLIEKLKKYANSAYIPMHMPGGKRNGKLLGMPEAFSMDITEIEGFDNLHNADGVLKYEMERAADIYGADESYICVNGSASALTAAICGAFEKGSKVLVARNCHISIINAIILRELSPLFLYPKKDENGIYKAIEPDEVRRMVGENPDIKGFIMTSPTYEGVVSDTQKIAAYLHAKDKILIVDEAHGAHFAFSDKFPENAVRSGADIAVNSLHKTLPALTQTAVLHISGSRADRKRIKSFWNIGQTTSPSYLLMGSISACFEFLESEKGKEQTEKYIKNLCDLRSSLSSLKTIKLFNSDDMGKIVLLTNNGVLLNDRLLSEHKIQTEMASVRYIVAMTAIADNDKFYDVFFEAIKSEDNTSLYRKERQSSLCLNDEKHLQKISPAAAFEQKFINGKMMPLESAEGLVCLENIIIYPPGTPLIVAGELITENDIIRIREAKDLGFTLIGADKNNLILVL